MTNLGEDHRPPAPGRPALPDDLRVVVGWRQGLGPLLAERWRQQGHKVILVLPRLPGPKHPLPEGLRVAVVERAALAAELREPSRLIARAEPWRKQAGRNLHVPAETGLHLLDLTVTGAEDVLATLAALGARPGRLLFLSDPRLLGRGDGRLRLTEEAPLLPEGPTQEALADAEAVARQSELRGRGVVALRVVPYLYGPGIEPLTPLGPDPRLADRLLHRDPILWVSGSTPVQPLHVEDLGATLDRLLRLPDVPSLLHLAGPETLSWEGLLHQLHRGSGATEPPSVEVLRPDELALRKPEAVRHFAELAHVPLLDDARCRQEVFTADRRLVEHAPAWLRWSLQQLGLDGRER